MLRRLRGGIDLHTTSEFYTLVLQSILEEIDVEFACGGREELTPSFTIRK